MFIQVLLVKAEAWIYMWNYMWNLRQKLFPVLIPELFSLWGWNVGTGNLIVNLCTVMRMNAYVGG